MAGLLQTFAVHQMGIIRREQLHRLIQAQRPSIRKDVNRDRSQAATFGEAVFKRTEAIMAGAKKLVDAAKLVRLRTGEIQAQAAPIALKTGWGMHAYSDEFI